jgi:hypothetical protein
MGQRQIDKGHMTLEMALPPGATLDEIETVLRSLAKLFPAARPPGFRRRRFHSGDIHGRRTLVLELAAFKGSIHYLLSFPPQYEGIIRSHVASVVPTVMFNAFDTPPGAWTYAVAVSRHSEEPPDAKLAPGILQSLKDLSDGEAVLVQFVLSPHGRTDIPGEFQASMRIAVRAQEVRAKQRLRHVLAAYRNVDVFTRTRLGQRFSYLVAIRAAPVEAWPDTLTSRELATLAGMTGNKGKRPQLPADPMIPAEGIVLGVSNCSASVVRPVAVSVKSLMQHGWVLGPTGSGKSALLHNVSAQIMAAGHGLLLIEPKGDLCRDVLGSVPLHRVRDVVWFDPTEQDRPIGLNVLAGDPETTGHVVSLFKNLYADSWGPRLEQILRYSVMTAAQARLTLYDVKQLLINPEFRAHILASVTDTELETFWHRLEDLPDAAVDSVVNKLDAFVGYRAIRNIVGQTEGLDLSEVVHRNKIVLAPLPTGDMGEEAAAMLGSLLVAQLWQAIRTRKTRAPYFLIADEMQKFVGMAGVSLEDILTLARSYGLGVIGANQHTDQVKAMLPTLKANARSIAVFATGSDDARKLAGEFAPLQAADLQALAQYEIAARLMTDSGMAPVATLKTNEPPEPSGYAEEALEASRAAYGVAVADVESAWRIRHTAKPETRRKRWRNIGKEPE